MTMAVSTVTGLTQGYAPGPSADAGAVGMSPDALLSYCQMQLGTLDDAVDQQMNLQKLELERRSAVQSVQTMLESFGSQGPAGGDDMQKCVDAFHAAIAKLPQGDPIATELSNQLNGMCQKYGFQEGHWETPLVAAKNTLASLLGVVLSSPSAGTAAPAGADGSSPQPIWVPPSIGKPLKNDEWKGTTDALGNVSDNIKTDAEIGMLQLQDLVSQRQQAVSLVTGMMSKEDQTLEDGAKAIGR